MKQMTCEMCGGADLVKRDGLYICENCNTKYSVEEAKKMMIEGTVQIEGIVKVDQSDAFNNLLDIANSSLLGGNGKDAFDYANKALEINQKSSMAWIVKMKSIENIGTVGDTRVIEAIACGNDAIKYSDINEKHNIEKQVYEYFLLRAVDLLSIAITKINEVANVKQIFQSMSLVNFITSASNTLNADSKYVSLMQGLVLNALSFKKAVPLDEIMDNGAYQNLASIIAAQYKTYQRGLMDRYKIYGAILTPEGANSMAETEKQLNEGVITMEEFNQRKEILEQRNKAIVNTYFAQNPKEEIMIQDKSSQIEPQITKIKVLSVEIDKLNSEKNDFEKQIEEIKMQIQKQRVTLAQTASKFLMSAKEKSKIIEATQECINKYEVEVDELCQLINEHTKEIEQALVDKNLLQNEIKPSQDFIEGFYKKITNGNSKQD